MKTFEEACDWIHAKEADRNMPLGEIANVDGKIVQAYWSMLNNDVRLEIYDSEEAFIAATRAEAAEDDDE